MDTIKLTRAQKDKIINELTSFHSSADEKIYFYVSFEDDYLEVLVSGSIAVDGRQDPQTGCWYETYRQANICLKGWLYDPITETEAEVNVDDDGEADKYMNEA